MKQLHVSFSVISGYETCNRYEVKNTLGQLVYFAAEENDDFTLNRYRQYRPFTIKLFDSRGQAAMQVKRPVQICGCCCPCVCCLDQVNNLSLLLVFVRLVDLVIRKMMNFGDSFLCNFKEVWLTIGISCRLAYIRGLYSGHSVQGPHASGWGAYGSGAHCQAATAHPPEPSQGLGRPHSAFFGPPKVFRSLWRAIKHHFWFSRKTTQ